MVRRSALLAEARLVRCDLSVWNGDPALNCNEDITFLELLAGLAVRTTPVADIDLDGLPLACGYKLLLGAGAHLAVHRVPGQCSRVHAKAQRASRVAHLEGCVGCCVTRFEYDNSFAFCRMKDNSYASI